MYIDVWGSANGLFLFPQALSQQSPQKGFSASQIALVSEQAEMIPWQVIWSASRNMTSRLLRQERWWLQKCQEQKTTLSATCRVWSSLSLFPILHWKFNSTIYVIILIRYMRKESGDRGGTSLTLTCSLRRWLSWSDKCHLVKCLVQQLSPFEERCFRNHLPVAWKIRVSVELAVARKEKRCERSAKRNANWYKWACHVIFMLNKRIYRKNNKLCQF